MKHHNITDGWNWRL